MLNTVDRCREAGAVDVLTMATHLVLPEGARERFVEKGVCCILGSDTFPGRTSDELIKVYSVAPLIAAELKNYLGL